MDVINNCKANVVYLEETKLHEPSPTIFRGPGGGQINVWCCKNAIRSAGGILIRINNSMFNVVDEWEGEFTLSCVIVYILNGWKQVSIVVYDPNQRPARPPLMG